MRITFLHTMTVGGLGPSFSLYVWSNTSSSVSRSGCHIGDLISLSGMMTTANTHTSVIITHESNSGCSRSRSENKVRHISVTHHRSFIRKKHSQNCCGWMWIQREGVKAASEKEYPNAWNSTACKQLLTENTQKYRAVIGQRVWCHLKSSAPIGWGSSDVLVLFIQWHQHPRTTKLHRSRCFYTVHHLTPPARSSSAAANHRELRQMPSP